MNEKNEVCVWTLILPPRLFLKLMFTFELCKILLDSLFFNPIGQGYRNKYNLVSCERKRELLSVLKKRSRITQHLPFCCTRVQIVKSMVERSIELIKIFQICKNQRMFISFTSITASIWSIN